MKKTTLLLISLIFCLNASTQDIDPYLDYLNDQNKSAKEYVLELFKEYDIVIICERNHKEFTQYELFRDIVKSNYFIDNVGNIFTEIGVSNSDSVINRFLHSEEYKDSITIRKQVTSIFRNTDSSPYWHCYSFPWFLTELYNINQTLSKEDKLTLHPSSEAFDWYSCKNADEYIAFDNSIVNRDSIMAQNVIKIFDQIQPKKNGNKKALVIMNYKHAFLKDHIFEGIITHNTGRYLADNYKGKVASVYIMGLAIPELGNYTIVKNGKWDYNFETSNKTNIGFNLSGSPFGTAVFDVIPQEPGQNFQYQDQFTGLVFYKPIQERYFKIGWQGFTTDEFVPELKRRIEIFNEAMDMGLTNDEMDELLYENNNEVIQQYDNIQELRKLIDQWKNGL